MGIPIRISIRNWTKLQILISISNCFKLLKEMQYLIGSPIELFRKGVMQN